MRAFEMTLAEHQKAVSADGFTLSQKAVIEHNLFAAKRIYENILFSELANLLGLDVKLAETVSPPVDLLSITPTLALVTGGDSDDN
jgi:COP9 signalosome complex subunit 4